MIVQKDAVDVTTYFKLVDATDGVTPETGLTITDLDLTYVRDRAAAVKADAIALAAVDGIHESNKAIEVDATNAPGVYRVDWSDAAFSTGVDEVQLVVNGAAITTAVIKVDLAPAVDVVSINRDLVAASNLEAQYDTTGLNGNTFPANQGQVDNLANVGSAINVSAGSYVLTSGAQGGVVANTEALDGLYHTHTDDSGAMDLYYEFSVTADGVPSNVTITGYLNGNNDDLGIYAFNWGSTTWIQVGTWVGNNFAVNVVNNFDLFTSHVGTGADDGKVRIRFFTASGLDTATLAIDQVFVSYSVVRQSVGYAMGAIWIDTVNGTAGDTPFTNGVADLPVDSIADAITLSTLMGLNRFHVVQGSIITFGQTMDNFVFEGLDYTIDFNGQQVDNSVITGAVVTGTATSNGGSLLLETCKIGPVTLRDIAIVNSALVGPITFTDTGLHFFDGCSSAIAGTTAPVIDFGSGVDGQNLNMRHYSGGVEVKNMTALDLMSLEGDGQLVIDSTCTGGTIAIRGHFTVTDEASGAVALSQDARYDTGQISDHASSKTVTGF